MNVFHNHLDVCQQCREHPWNLCPTGAQLLKEAATTPDPLCTEGGKAWTKG